MVEAIVDVILIVISIIGASIVIDLIVAPFRARRARRSIAGMQSGIYVKHGMVMDPTTGKVQSQSSPSDRAYRDLG